MMCPFCRAIEGEGDCPECRALAAEVRANREAMGALRDLELPPLVIGVSRRLPVYPWVAAAAAVVLAIGLPFLRHTVPTAPRPPARSVRPEKGEPLKIKMLTPDPDVVIYWLIDSKEGE